MTALIFFKSVWAFALCQRRSGDKEAMLRSKKHGEELIPYEKLSYRTGRYPRKYFVISNFVVPARPVIE